MWSGNATSFHVVAISCSVRPSLFVVLPMLPMIYDVPSPPTATGLSSCPPPTAHAASSSSSSRVWFWLYGN